MSQLTFAEAEYEHKKRKTRRELFLDRMEGLIPWKRLEKKIARYYVKAGRQGGRLVYPLPVKCINESCARMKQRELLSNLLARCRILWK
ncbi:MAG: hypothetical protein RQ899_07900 [Pseudomonadales bacterium]|nr:hypothetical protein [Pseudomonadales bacterium]